ncbi:MAG: GyrI-like domain-containing protein [Pseudomonadota bacterium]|nr:GyrI-like domain-containing protein [Pseudomonadota bacterium]
MVTLPNAALVESRAKLIIGLADDFTLETRTEIPKLYQRYFAIQDGIKHRVSDVLYGVSMSAKPDGSFRYGVGIEVEEAEDLPEGACEMHLVEGDYVVFSQRTPIAELPARFDAIFSEWLPKSDVVQREGSVFECYPDDASPEDGKMLYEIWVPVAPK